MILGDTAASQVGRSYNLINSLKTVTMDQLIREPMDQLMRVVFSIWESIIFEEFCSRLLKAGDFTAERPDSLRWRRLHRNLGSFEAPCGQISIQHEHSGTGSDTAWISAKDK